MRAKRATASATRPGWVNRNSWSARIGVDHLTADVVRVDHRRAGLREHVVGGRVAGLVGPIPSRVRTRPGSTTVTPIAAPASISSALSTSLNASTPALETL